MKKNKARSAAKLFGIARLTDDPGLQMQYNVTIQNKFDVLIDLSDSVDDAWNLFCTTAKEPAQETRNQKVCVQTLALSGSHRHRRALVREKYLHLEKMSLDRNYWRCCTRE